MTVADLSAWELRRNGTPVGSIFDELLADSQFSDPSMNIGAAGEIKLAANAVSSIIGAPVVICELRQHAAGRDVSSWTASQEGYLSASLAINSVPIGADGMAAALSVLRVHGAGGELAALRYVGGQLRLELSRMPDGSHRTLGLLAANGDRPSISLGERFDCFVRVTMTTVTASVIHGGRTYLCTGEVSRDWLKSFLHFSAGVCFDRDGSSGEAQVTLFALASPSLARSPQRASDARRVVASAELVVKLTDGERLSFPVAVPQRRHLRH